jgi:two-component system osmolarity sensor histidine kinase EnvZ
MFFGWLKRYMPRSLYGRAALILVLPVVTLQLVVSLVFIQRHFEGVTQQMTRNIVLELTHIVSEIETIDAAQDLTGSVQRIGAPFQIDIDVIDAGHVADQRAFYDLSGKAMIETLRLGLPTLGAVDLSQDKRVLAEIDTQKGRIAVTFDRRRVSASNPHQLLVVIVVLGVLMSLISFIFLRNQLRPIKRLARASEAFGKGRVELYKPSGAVEVRAAGSAFLDMRARIERQIEQRTTMLSGISHDLRTPLTRLKLGLSLMEAEDVKELERDVEDMQRLVDSFLNFARDGAEEEPSIVNVANFLMRVKEDARRSAFPVDFAMEPPNRNAAFRPMAVRRALDNLISNGARYGQNVLLSAVVSEKALVFVVEDDGPGIPSQDRDEALAPFSRLEPARNQNKGTGVGLGLTIAHDVARAHGGTLRLGQSETLGGLQAELILAR